MRGGNKGQSPPHMAARSQGNGMPEPHLKPHNLLGSKLQALQHAAL